MVPTWILLYINNVNTHCDGQMHGSDWGWLFMWEKGLGKRWWGRIFRCLKSGEVYGSMNQCFFLRVPMSVPTCMHFLCMQLCMWVEGKGGQENGSLWLEYFVQVYDCKMWQSSQFVIPQHLLITCYLVFIKTVNSHRNILVHATTSLTSLCVWVGTYMCFYVCPHRRTTRLVCLSVPLSDDFYFTNSFRIFSAFSSKRSYRM